VEIPLNGRTIDLAKALPLRMRDLLAMERQGVNVDKAMADIKEGKTEGLFNVALYILRKADGGVTTEDELGDLSPQQFLVLWNRINDVNLILKEAEVPFASSSTS